MTFKLLNGGRIFTMGLGVGLAWACAVSDKKDFTFDDSPDAGGRGGSSASGGKGGKGGGAAGSAGRASGGRGGAAGSSGLAGEAGEAGQAGQGQGGQGAEGGQGAGSGGKGGTGGLPPCDTGEKRCMGACIDVQEDNDNCGDCGVECDATHFCKDGACELDCRSNETICDGACVDTNSDHDHCGSCTKVCTSREACNMGTCSLDCGGLTNCNGACVDLTSSAQHCGDCDTVCGGNTECVSSMCGCTGGLTLCQENMVDVCLDTDTDPDNCGDCDQVCNLANAVASCVGGSCAISACSNNTADCNRMPGDGCEVDRDDDVNNCGACSNACNLANAVEDCIGGTCTVASCSGVYDDCNSTDSDGCETNTDTDPDNCGGCDDACNLANATAGCSGGNCTVASCSGAFRNCNMMPGDGCEINSNTNPQHCGGCNSACVVPNATPGCSGGMCTVGSCTGAFRNCNNMVSDGCEINSNNNVSHCGGCGNACNLANATPTCSGGNCAISSCNANFNNCNNMPGDGCESDRRTDVNNCGVCGNACGMGAVCTGGVCKDKVLLVIADSAANITDVQSRIAATGVFQVVDTYDAYMGATPTVAQLNNYAAVLVFSDNNFSNPTTMGDNLASYFDGGGRVVPAVFGVVSGYEILGRWSTGGYRLMTPGSYIYTATTTTPSILEASNSLVSGVSTFGATMAFRNQGALLSGSTSVINWSDGTALGIRGSTGGRTHVELNMWPVSSTTYTGAWTGDGARLMANALRYGARCRNIYGNGGAACPTGRTQICYANTPSATSAAQAAAACQACFGSACTVYGGDCAGNAYYQNASPASGDAGYGYAAGCSGVAGRIFYEGSSYTTYGWWADP